MTKMFSRNAVRAAAVALMALLACALLASCSPAEKEKTPAQLNREYMAAVSENVDDLAAEMQVFSDAVGEQDVASMTLSAERAAKIIDSIEALQAPEALAKVHEAYVAGARGLLDALDAYVALYADLASGAVEPADAQTRLKAIQSDYDKAIAQLEQADSLAIEVAGIEVDSQGSSKDSSKSGSSASGDASAAASGDASGTSDASASGDSKAA